MLQDNLSYLIFTSRECTPVSLSVWFSISIKVSFNFDKQELHNRRHVAVQKSLGSCILYRDISCTITTDIIWCYDQRLM